MNATNPNSRMGKVNPLLMNFTPVTTIIEQEEENLLYNDFTQTIMYNMRTVGTRCLRSSSTRKKLPGGSTNSKVDRKNEIDDSKSVK